MEIFLNPSSDSTKITNVAFGIAASLSALSLSCARAIGGPQAHKDRFAYAGERLFQAGLLWLVASVLKYATTSLDYIELSSIRDWMMVAPVMGVNFASRVTTGILFLAGSIISYVGLSAVNEVLWARIKLPR